MCVSNSSLLSFDNAVFSGGGVCYGFECVVKAFFAVIAANFSYIQNFHIRIQQQVLCAVDP